MISRCTDIPWVSLASWVASTTGNDAIAPWFHPFLAPRSDMSAPVAFEPLISDFELESTFTYKEGLAWERPKIFSKVQLHSSRVFFLWNAFLSSVCTYENCPVVAAIKCQSKKKLCKKQWRLLDPRPLCSQDAVLWFYQGQYRPLCFHKMLFEAILERCFPSFSDRDAYKDEVTHPSHGEPRW